MSHLLPKLFCCATLTFSSEGQSLHPASQAVSETTVPAPEKANSLPTHEIEFAAATVIEGVAGGVGIVMPTKCTPDAAAYITMLLPGFENRKLFAVHDGKGTSLDPENIPGLREVSTLDFYPSSSEFAFLVRGSPVTDPALAANEAASKRAKAEQAYFVAVFDHLGGFKRLLSLPAGLVVGGLALLDSGEVILSGYDLVNDVPSMLILDRTGQIERAVDQPMPARDRVGGLNGQVAAASTHFASHGQNVVVWRMGRDAPLLEIASGAVVREVPVHLEKGDTLIDVIPSGSGDPLIFHVDRAQDGTEARSGLREVGPGRYIEVSPLDGAIVRKLTFPGTVSMPLACRADGSYVVFSGNAKKQLLEYEGK